MSSYANFAFDMFFLVDIVVNFNTAYMDDTGTVIRDHSMIAHQYLRSDATNAQSCSSPTSFYPLARRGRRGPFLTLPGTVRGWFTFDVVSSIPLDRAICLTNPNNASFLRVFKAFRLLKMFRCAPRAAAVAADVKVHGACLRACVPAR